MTVEVETMGEEPTQLGGGDRRGCRPTDERVQEEKEATALLLFWNMQ